jgi:hypothetical protein
MELLGAIFSLGPAAPVRALVITSLFSAVYSTVPTVQHSCIADQQWQAPFSTAAIVTLTSATTKFNELARARS